MKQKKLIENQVDKGIELQKVRKNISYAVYFIQKIIPQPRAQSVVLGVSSCMARTLIPLGYLIENQDGSVRLFD
jgi:hypothetical protein